MARLAGTRTRQKRINNHRRLPRNRHHAHATPRLSPATVAPAWFEGRRVEYPTDVSMVFQELKETWRNETWFISSIKKRTSHPSYLKIIGLGLPALPSIFAELRREPDYWFLALEAITREDPAPDAESMEQLISVWLAWANEHGY